MDGQRTIADRYRLLDRLGSGGMGTVWRAHDDVLGREVAVKEVVFPPGLSDADRSVLQERTRREARAAARLDHPSAVTVYDVVEHDGAPYLVMELVEARTLAEVVRAEGPLPPDRVAQVGLDLLGALEAAHAQGIVHRDVKPSNVLVRASGPVVLTDFGIATTTGDSTLTHTGLLLGSPAYIAPERARGEAPGPASDLWSLGATLYTAVEGHPPFDGGEPMLTVTAVVTGEPQPYAAAGPLAPVLDGLLAKDPAERFDAATAAAMLRSVVEGPPAPTAVSTTPLPAPVTVPASTAALDLGEVRQRVGAPQPVRHRETVLAPARPAGGTRGRTAALVAGALVLLGGATAIALSAAGDDPGGSRAATLPSTDPGEQADPSAPAQDEPADETSDQPADEPADEGRDGGGDDGGDGGGGSGTAAGLPEGWSTAEGSAGWTVALPPGYSSSGGGEYVQSSTGRTLRVETGKGKKDAVADREAQAKDFERRHPTYEEIRIDAADYRGYEAADWEFTYEGLHAVNRVFVTPDGTGYSLFFQTPEGDFGDAEPEYERIVEAFQPASG